MESVQETFAEMMKRLLPAGGMVPGIPLALDTLLPKHTHPVPPPVGVSHLYCPGCSRMIC